jgi:hypothetical protein
MYDFFHVSKQKGHAATEAVNSDCEGDGCLFCLPFLFTAAARLRSSSDEQQSQTIERRISQPRNFLLCPFGRFCFS